MWSLIPAAVLGLLVAGGDYSLARSVRTAAYQVCEQYQGGGGKLLFEGHWGFQYYMESRGAQALDVRNVSVHVGDVLVIPDNNTNILLPPPGTVNLIERMEVPVGGVVSVMSLSAGTGFHCGAYWGPLPFDFGAPPPEAYAVYSIDVPIVVEP